MRTDVVHRTNHFNHWGQQNVLEVWQSFFPWPKGKKKTIYPVLQATTGFHTGVIQDMELKFISPHPRDYPWGEFTALLEQRYTSTIWRSAS